MAHLSHLKRASPSFSLTSLIKVQRRRKSHWNPLRKADRVYSGYPSFRANQLTWGVRENKEHDEARDGFLSQSLKLNRLCEIETRSGLRLPNVSIRWYANNTRRNLTDGYVSRYRITMHYRPNAIKTNADEKHDKFLPLRFKALENEACGHSYGPLYERYSTNDYSYNRKN